MFPFNFDSFSNCMSSRLFAQLRDSFSHSKLSVLLGLALRSVNDKTDESGAAKRSLTV